MFIFSICATVESTSVFGPNFVPMKSPTTSTITTRTPITAVAKTFPLIRSFGFVEVIKSSIVLSLFSLATLIATWFPNIIISVYKIMSIKYTSQKFFAPSASRIFGSKFVPFIAFSTISSSTPAFLK